MTPDYPLTFTPLLRERVWGGNKLATLFGKAVPPGARIGESWEITDRAEGVSIVSNGPLAGRSLRDLLQEHASALLGDLPAPGGQFPWLVKILDAREDLSLQVHPPASKAAALRGEPKTEMWYVADTEPGALLHVGLQPGVSRAAFESRTRDGSVAGCFHRHAVRPGDVMFVPSGRVHALGAGNVVFEIQQNSDTTYRVFDWNRVGLDGRPRELHLEPAFESIDYEDTLPALVPELWHAVGAGVSLRPLVHHPLFDIDLLRLDGTHPTNLALRGGPGVVGCVEGAVTVATGASGVRLDAGQFALVPANCGEFRMEAAGNGGRALVVRKHAVSGTPSR